MVLRKIISFFLCGCLGIAIMHGVTWQGPGTLYIGFPGATTERYAFLGKYSTAFVATTGESVVTRSMDIVDPRKTIVITFSEIIAPRDCWWFQRSWNTFWRQKTWVRQTGAACITPPLCDYSIASYGVKRSEVNMGQRADLKNVDRQFAWWRPVMESLKYKFVWVAYSRGVTAALRYCVTCPQAQLPHALVLEGGVDSVPHFLAHLFDTHTPEWTQGTQRPICINYLLLWGFKTFFAPSYQYEPWDRTLYCINAIPAHIPVLLVTSFGDELVSYRSTLRLYQQFKSARGPGCDNVHILILSRARHSYYVDGTNNALDRDNYQRCVHAFYKKYGLAHDAQLAYEGTEIFRRTNEVDVAALLQGSTCKVCNAVCRISTYPLRRT